MKAPRLLILVVQIVYLMFPSFERYILGGQGDKTMGITKIQSPDGSEIYVQYDERDSDEFYAVSITDDILERTQRFQECVEQIIKGYALIVLDRVQKGFEKGSKPSKVNLEFGIQVGGEAGVPFVTKGTAQANIKVSVEWQMS